jgi:hypothetical protein
MKKLLLLIAALVLSGLSQSLMAQAFTFTSGQKTYSENFDAMGSAGTTFLPGWTSIRYAGTGTIGAVLTMVVTDGSANSGAVYNVGTTGSEERAFGMLASGSTTPSMGAQFLNSTGSTITQANISGIMEQWRSGSNDTVNEVTSFEYSLDATDLATGTWTAVTGLDLLEKITTSTISAALDGNLPENQTAISGTLTGLAWSNGANLWIRWSDVNNFGTDGLYAIDNLSMTVSGTVGIDSKNNPNVGRLSMYPNPGNGNILLTMPSQGNYEIRVFSLVGELLFKTDFNGVSDQINLSNLPKGIYIVNSVNTISRETNCSRLIIK